MGKRKKAKLKFEQIMDVCHCGSIEEAFAIARKNSELALAAGQCPAWITAVGFAQFLIGAAALDAIDEGDAVTGLQQQMAVYLSTNLPAILSTKEGTVQ